MVPVVSSFHYQARVELVHVCQVLHISAMIAQLTVYGFGAISYLPRRQTASLDLSVNCENCRLLLVQPLFSSMICLTSRTTFYAVPMRVYMLSSLVCTKHTIR